MKYIKFKNEIIPLLLTLGMIACTPKPISDQEAIKKEIENREIKRVTKSEILKLASEKGDLISTTAQNNLSKILTEKIQTEGVLAAIEHCNVVAIPLVDSLSQVFGARIRRVSDKARNPVDLPDSTEADVLDAYYYAFENSIPLESSVEEINAREIHYTKPILVSNPLCLNCHGAIGTEIVFENYDVITSHYPSDSATGYKIGDLRGMWSIRFLKKTLIQSMD